MIARDGGSEEENVRDAEHERAGPGVLSALRSDAAAAGQLSFPDPVAPVTFHFDTGSPPPETFPVEDLKRIAAAVVDDPGALEYKSFGVDPQSGLTDYMAAEGRWENSYGYTGLRRCLADWLGATQAVELTADNFILTSGAVQAIALAVSAFLNPGDGALVETLTFPYAVRSMRMHGVDVRTVDLDHDGLRIDALERRLDEMRRDGVRPKLLYTIPTFHLPTGAVLPLDRRRRMLELAEEWDLVVIEDAIYNDLRYDGEPLPTLLELDRGGRVLQSHGFSKIVAPGLRLGWMCGPVEGIEALGAAREDLGVSQWTARIMARFMQEGLLDPHIARGNALYRSRRDAAATAMRRHGGGLVSFAEPLGGFYLWVRVDDAVDWPRAVHRAGLGGVMVRDSARFSYEGEGGTYFRLPFSRATEDELDRGIAILCDAIAQSATAGSLP
jgi:2-aminoadipate transaminase